MKLHLSLFARGLSSDATSVKVKISTLTGSRVPVDLGETEKLKGSDPNWKKAFSFDYNSEGDESSRRITLDLHGENGSWICSRSFVVGEILGKRGGVEAKKLTSSGFVIAHIGTISGSLKLQLRGKELKNLDGLGIIRKSDPFYALMRLNNETENWDAAHRSETMKNDLNPVWTEDEVDLMVLCDGDLDMRLRIVVFDDEDKKKTSMVRQSLSLSRKSNDQSFEVMGYCETSVSKLLEAKASNLSFALVNKGKEVGQINVLKAERINFDDAKEATIKLIKAAVAKISAEEAEKTLHRAIEEVEAARKVVEEKEAALEVASMQAESARQAFGDVEWILSEWPSALRLDI